MAAAAVPLIVGGVRLAAPPAHAADPLALFRALCGQFRIDEAFADHLVTTVGCDSLEDFKYLVTDAAKLDDIVNEMLCHLWQQAVGLWWLHAAAAQKRGREQDDLDLLLLEAVIIDLRKAFWARYRVAFRAFEEPSDYLLSRITKELEKRLLQVHPVFKVRTLTHQLRAEREKQRVTDGLVLVMQEQEEDPAPQHTVTQYLALHHTLMLAYARAGVTPIDPPPGVQETFGSDSTDYVLAPLDVLLKFHSRLK
eukprot:3350461-Amphidinium_carterae.2